MNGAIYGYDRHMKAIRHGSIVRYRDKLTGCQQVGHVWYTDDWLCEGGKAWRVSTSHTYSESNQDIEEGDNYRVIGNVEINPDDEDMMEFNVERSHFFAKGGSWRELVTWTPYPHWTSKTL